MKAINKRLREAANQLRSIGAHPQAQEVEVAITLWEGLLNPTEESIHSRIRQLIADGNRLGLHIAVSIGKKEYHTDDD